jgi:hypothetical protein
LRTPNLLHLSSLGRVVISWFHAAENGGWHSGGFFPVVPNKIEPNHNNGVDGVGEKASGSFFIEEDGQVSE